MPDDIIKSSPESTDPNALKIGILTLLHPTAGEVKIPYAAIVDYPSYVAAITNNALGASKTHVSFWNGTNRRIRIRKIEASAELTGNVTGAKVMLSVEALSAIPTQGTGTLVAANKLSTNAENLPTGLSIIANPQTANFIANFVICRKSISIEEAVTTVDTNIELFKKDTELSSIQLESGQGIGIRQGTVTVVGGAINFFISFTLD